MFSVEFDDEGLTVDLGVAADRLPDEARRVVARGALNVKRAMQADAEGSRHFKMARHISYDLHDEAMSSEAVIGPEKVGAGNLANIAYFGGAHGGGGTVRDPMLALEDEAPAFVRFLAEAMDGLL